MSVCFLMSARRWLSDAQKWRGVTCCAVLCCAGGSLGSTPLWHALIRYPQRHQHITLAYPQQLFAARSQVRLGSLSPSFLLSDCDAPAVL